MRNAALDSLGNDLLIRCSSYLDADGLAQLGRTITRFGIPQAGQQSSLVNEAAHQQFRQCATDEERSRLPKYDGESDVGLYRALVILRQPLCFDDLVGNGFGPHENPASVTGTGKSWSTTMSGHVMRGGRHFVEFNITNDEPDRQYINQIINLGVIRPVNDINWEGDWRGSVYPVAVSSSFKPAVSEKLRSQRTAKWRDSNIHCCAYLCANGQCAWTDWNISSVYSDWQGMEVLTRSGTIGLLLDLDEGNLSVFKNGRRLGVMKDGFDGEYCWFTALRSSYTVSIQNGDLPTDL